MDGELLCEACDRAARIDQFEKSEQRGRTFLNRAAEVLRRLLLAQHESQYYFSLRPPRSPPED